MKKVECTIPDAYVRLVSNVAEINTIAGQMELLETGAFVDTYAKHFEELERLLYRAVDMTSNVRCLIIVREVDDDELLLGYAWYHMMNKLEAEAAPTLAVNRVVTRPSYYGYGVASTLLWTLETLAEKMSAVVALGASTEEATRLCVKAGYSRKVKRMINSTSSTWWYKRG